MLIGLVIWAWSSSSINLFWFKQVNRLGSWCTDISVLKCIYNSVLNTQSQSISSVKSKMNLLTLCTPSALVLFLTSTFGQPTLTNAINQIIIFLVTAHVPALITGRMSYVDIAWPWGLISIGLLPLFSPPDVFTVRTYLVMSAFILAGGRMALGKTTGKFCY